MGAQRHALGLTGHVHGLAEHLLAVGSQHQRGEGRGTDARSAPARPRRTCPHESALGPWARPRNGSDAGRTRRPGPGPRRSPRERSGGLVLGPLVRLAVAVARGSSSSPQGLFQEGGGHAEGLQIRPALEGRLELGEARTASGFGSARRKGRGPGPEDHHGVLDARRRAAERPRDPSRSRSSPSSTWRLRVLSRMWTRPPRRSAPTAPPIGPRQGGHGQEQCQRPYQEEQRVPEAQRVAARARLVLQELQSREEHGPAGGLLPQMEPHGNQHAEGPEARARGSGSSLQPLPHGEQAPRARRGSSSVLTTVWGTSRRRNRDFHSSMAAEKRSA